MIGSTLGRYQILDRLGEGGMGEVYRAHDPRLGRDVALKVVRGGPLRGENLHERFRTEARVLSRLVHPHIATLFDFDRDGDTDFLVLEFVPGQTLARALERGPLPESRVRAIGLEIADALQAAHEQGVVHRDLKPGNVMLTPRGRAKVLDFGLAHVLGDPRVSASSASTSTGSVLVGTIPYMAPEQVRGERVDARTDIHALGALLFEMVTGAPPFRAPDAASTLYRIAHEPAPGVREARPGLSEAFARIVARCLEKEPAQRFADVEALALALREEPGAASARAAEAGGVASSSGSGILRSIVVLPFENRSGDPSQEFFADGMTDALIADLAQIEALRVISRTSAMRFKNSGKSVPEITRELGVDAVVEGTAVCAGDRARITVQLIEAKTDRSRWAMRYDRELTDILTLQSEVASAIAAEIRIQVTPEERERLKPRGPVVPAAHVAYLQGRFAWNRWNTESLLRSLEFYREAIAADPNFALAYAGLADSYSVLGNTHVIPPGEARTQAREAAERGLAIDDSLAELHVSLGYVMRLYEWDWPGAEREMLRGLHLNPGYAIGHHRYALLLTSLGRHAEAIAEAERSITQDPLSLVAHTVVGDAYFYARRFDRAVRACERCLDLDPTFEPGCTDLARALEFTGRTDEAVRMFLRAVPLVNGSPKPSSGLATMYWSAGRHDEARAMMLQVLATAEHQYVSPWGIGSYFARVGDNDRALEWLEKAFAARDWSMSLLGVHPRLDGLRGEPRFRALLEQMQLHA